MTAEIFDADGINTVLWWLVFTEGDNRQLLANNTQPCNNATSCVINTEFTNLTPGQYVINILAQTTQGTSIQTETPITVQ